MMTIYFKVQAVAATLEQRASKHEIKGTNMSIVEGVSYPSERMLAQQHSW